MRKQKRNHKKLITHMIFAYLMLFCTLTGFFTLIGDGHTHVQTAEAATGTCPVEGYDTLSGKTSTSMSYLGGTLTSRATNSERMSFPISVFGNKVPKAGESYPASSLLNKASAYFYLTHYEKLSCSFCGTAHPKESGSTTYYFCNKEELDKNVVVWGVTYNSSTDTFTLGTVASGSSYVKTYFGSNYIMSPVTAGTHTYSTSHTCTGDCKERLHTHVDSFDETEYTYTCTGTATWYQKFYENTSNTQQSCGHYGNPYIAVHYCNMCGEQVYTKYMEGCNTTSCSNYLHPAAESTSHPGTHTYKHQGVRYECTKTTEIVDKDVYMGAIEHQHLCAYCGASFYEEISGSGYTTDYSCGMPSKHYYYVKEAAPDSCYSYSQICTGTSSQSSYTTYYDACTCTHYNSDYTASVDFNFQATGYKYTCKTCKLLYLDKITYSHEPNGVACGFWSPWTETTLGSQADINPRISFIGKPYSSMTNHNSGSYSETINYTAMHRTQTFHCTKAEYGNYICDQVVTALLPIEPEQTIGAGQSINTKAYAKFLNGTIAEVTCQITGIDNTKYNEWQTVTLSYGTYSSVGNKTPRTATISVYIERVNFDVTATVGNAEMGSVTGGGSYTVGTEVTVVATPANGYRFAGWYKNGSTYVSGNTSYTFTMPNENVSLVARFTENYYNLTVSSESTTKGTVTTSSSPYPAYKQSVTVGAVPNPGFSFAGWYEGGTLKSSSASYTFSMPAQKVSLVAKFNLASYTVSFNSNGGSACSAITVSYLGAYGTLPTPTKSGYLFAGWKYDGSAVTSATPVTATGNHTLTATWAPAGPAFIMVTHGLPYGNNSWSRDNSNLGSFGLNTSNLQAWLPFPGKPGYDFIGWYRTENSAGNGNDLGKPAENTVTKDTLVNIKGQHTLHAGWTEKTFTLSFDSNGGTACSNMSITYDRKYNHHQNLPKPTKDGFVFGGWYTAEVDENGCGTVISNEDRVQATADQKLYAKWTEEGNGGSGDGTKTVTVTYMPGGTKITYTYPGKYNPTASAPTKTGYNFANYWLYGNVQIKADGSTSLQEEFDHTVTAAFTPKTPTVKLDQQGATTAGTTSVKATYDAKLPAVPVLPKKTGYTFGGYFTGTGGTGDRYYDSNGRSELICQFESDITLYAYWIKQKVITYYPNGGSGSMAPTYVEHGSTSALIKSNGFSRTGHEFIRWNTKVDGSGKDYTPGTYVSDISSDLTLYAQWKEQKNTITYDANGGEGFMPVTELAYNVTTTTLSKNSFTRAGHNFTGWATTPDGAVAYKDGASITFSGNIILYAKWQEKTVNYDLVYYKYPHGSADTAVWQRTNGISYKKEITILGAPYEPSPYTVTYYINKPSGMSSVPESLNLTGENTATGISTFLHWSLYQAKDGTYQYTDRDYRPNEKVTALSTTHGEVLYMYPVWTGADASVLLPSTGADGYIFKGWSEAQDGSSTFYVPKTSGNTEVSGRFTPTKNTKFYAQWEPVGYEIYFDYQKPAKSTQEMTGNGTESKAVTFDSAVGTLPSPQITGWTFLGWFTETGGKGTQITASTKWTYAKNVTLYAYWTADTYTVTLDPAGGKPTPAPTIKATYDADMPSVTPPTRKYTVTFNANTGTCGTTSLVSEYTFGGYFTGKNGTGTQYYKADGTSARAWDIAQNTTLYAKWTSKAVTLPTPTKTGYTFQGWYTAASGGTKIGVAGASYTPTADITLYAQWKANELDIALNDRGATSTNHTKTVHMVYDEKGKDIILPTKTGYTFQGYYTGIRGSGKKYYDGTGICITEWKEVNITELFAYWIQDEIIIPEEDDITEPTPLPEQDMEGSVGRSDAKGLLYADDYEDSTGALNDLQPYLVYDTDASKGVIPGTEKLSFRAKMGEWIFHYKLHRNTGTDYVKFYVTVPYRTQYERTEDEKLVISARQNKTYTFLLPKVWDYWEIIESGMYYPEKITVTNQAIKNYFAVIPVKRERNLSGAVPAYDVKQYGDKTAHVFWDKHDADGYPVLDITLTDEQYIISDVPDTLPDIDAVLEVICRNAARADTRQPRVRSDRFLLDGNVILSDEFEDNGTGAGLRSDALERFANSGKIAETSYLQAYMSGIELDEEKPNGEYKTSAMITYTGDESNINTPEYVTVELTDMNPIRIHTPVVCLGKIDDGPEITETGYILTLKDAMNFFTVSVDNAGTHRISFGYGTKDYAFALSGKSNMARQEGVCLNQVQFPFEVYVDVGNDSKQSDGSVIPDGDFLLTEGTWFTVGTRKQQFYVPVTMKNGKYQIKFRSVAANCPKDNTGQLVFGEEEFRANVSPSCYVAADVIEVEVRSYLRDFKITSVNDPLAAEQLENGCQALTLKKGYGFSFELLSQGEFYGDSATIHIVPSFFWESEDGTNRREVKLYHTGKIPKDISKICYDWKEEPILRRHENYDVILQRFLGTGFIPADILCVAKEFPLEEYAKKNTFSGREDFFFRTGYLIIHFDISVKSNEGVVYNYNKWQETKLFEDATKGGWGYIPGDIIRYDLSKSIAEDYEIGGSE